MLLTYLLLICNGIIFVSDLQKFVVPIVMSGNNRWTLDTWHVKFALLNQGILLEENCIKIPEEKISGPNEAIEGGEFLLTLKVKPHIYIFNLRLRIHNFGHLSKEESNLFSVKCPKLLKPLLT